MSTFFINKKEVSYDDSLSLLQILRDKEGLTSAKDGCSEGACGTCTVLVDGKATRACIMRPSRLEGKQVVTLEGLTPREKDVYSYCFGKMGAVQCGFCIPGMIISAKALLDQNLTPTRKDVKNAIKGNICRCTGYQKIEDAILLAADFLRENKEVPAIQTDVTAKIGESIFRLDAKAKALGEAIYVDDITVEGMLYGSAVRTPYPRAKVLSINLEKAKAHPDCVAALTAEDVPGERFIGHLAFLSDWPALIAVGEETRYVGDAIVLIASKNKYTLEEIKGLVEIEYEELTPLTTTQAALAEGAPNIHPNGNLLSHEHLVRGDVQTALKNSKYTVTETFKTPHTEHAFLEPECAIGIPDGDGILLYTGGQSIYDEQREVGRLLGLPPEKVRVQAAYVGGGFGGKEDMSVQHHAGMLAFVIGQPVKVTLSRKESLKVHPKRHPAEMEFTLGCDEQGHFTALQASIVTDTGAYASLGGPVLQRACTHAAGPYNYQNIDIDGKAVYTNNPPSGAFRGFGVTQSAFAIESCINKLAQLTGLSTWEIRYRNAIRPGQTLPNGQIADPGTGMVETLEAVKEQYDANKYVGIACAMKNAGLGVGLPDFGRCNVVYENGKVHLRSSAACIGQGFATILMQEFCQTTGIPMNQVVVESPDTMYTPNSGTTTASRQTAISGEAGRLAALKFKAALENSSLEELEGQIFSAEFSPETDKLGSDKPNPVSHLSYGYATQIVILNDEGEVTKVVAAHDVGKAVNPVALEGQIEGGVVMGLGYGLTEDYPLDNGVPTGKFGTIGLFRANMAPEIESIIIEKNSMDSVAYGAKGVGEITTIPTAPACQGAYLAFDGKFRTQLPLEDTFYRKAKK